MSAQSNLQSSVIPFCPGSGQLVKPNDEREISATCYACKRYFRNVAMEYTAAIVPAHKVTLPYRRFREDTPTGAEVIAWIESHSPRYVWAQGPMDSSPSKCYVASRVKTWKRNPNRFQFSVYSHHAYNERHTFDNGVLDRIRIPNSAWWHGITATVTHEYGLSNGYRGTSAPGYYKRYGMWDGSTSVVVSVVSKHVVLHQSNGLHLDMRSLNHAIRHCRNGNIRLTVGGGRGKRTRVLVEERAMGENDR